MLQDSVIFLQASDSNANVDGMHPNTFFPNSVSLEGSNGGKKKAESGHTGGSGERTGNAPAARFCIVFQGFGPPGDLRGPFLQSVSRICCPGAAPAIPGIPSLLFRPPATTGAKLVQNWCKICLYIFLKNRFTKFKSCFICFFV